MIFIKIALIIMSYIYGSIPFALVIGKLFYQTDVREHGSGNLGGTNAGRVLGKKVGLSVIILDASKCLVSVLIARFVSNIMNFSPDIIYPCALACIIGHCYPCFAQFRGGKAVSVAMGYALATSFIAFVDSIVVFLIVLKLSKYVSLSSMMSAISVFIVSIIVGYPTIGLITNFFIVALIIFKHKDNIKRIMNHTENKVTWI